MVRRPSARPPRPPTPAPPEYDAADAAFVASLLAPRWTVESLIATGPLACTHLVRESVTGRPAVARVVHARLARDETASAHIQRLTRADLGIHHPNVVRTFAVSPAAAPAPWAICEYVEGMDLGALIAAGAPFAPARAAGIARDIAAALAAAHQAGVVHGNLRPAGVLVEHGTGMAKVYEFDSPLFGEAGFLNDPTYAAPEQVQDPGSGAQAAADLFALGTILYEMLAGRLPWAADTAIARMVRQFKDPPAPLPDAIPAGLGDLVVRLLAPTPRARGTAVLARDALASFAG